ncbi:PLP-dependent aminotransferase family protein [Pleurocapsales cyanobacterium LEGE 06147]|nr:PLP-dependent aminotransferase family protein [Pleurocapsales cyanobacterium LEGE 06147]
MDLAIFLDRTSAIPIYQQLAEKLRHAVLEGRLKPNQKLPSSRTLAKSLNISRFTVTQSYEQLESEGYLETRCGAGTYVCSQIPDDWLQSKAIELVAAQSSRSSVLSQFGNNLISVKHLEVSEPENEISFRYGNPAVEFFPISQWRRLLSRHCKNSPTLLHYTPDAAGYFPLRVEIANYLGRSRAVRCTPEQVIIVNGSQQALNLIARPILDPGDWVAMEDPGYLGARYCFRGQGANLQPIAVNSEGLDVEALARCHQKFKLVYVTPSHQFPTGVTLTLAQRIALLQWAQTTETLIIEDDYDSEYRYGEQPIPALQGMDRSQSVIYVGTFSKTMFPSLRIGYLVVPLSWISLVSKAKWLCDRASSLLEQYALTDWIAEGHFERHIRRMRHLYNLRRQVLIEAFQNYFGSRITILGANAGIHVMVKIETGLSDDMVIQKAAGVGVGLISAREYYWKPQHQGEFIFGYAQLEETQIEQGIFKLSQILEH